MSISLSKWGKKKKTTTICFLLLGNVSLGGTLIIYLFKKQVSKPVQPIS